MDRLAAPLHRTAEPFRRESFPASSFNPQNWPPQPGDYTIFNATAPLAIVEVGASRPAGYASLADLEGIAVSGRLSTENIGIEYLVKNSIANPHLRHLAVIGADISGHRPGDALINLAANGMDREQRIIGAAGARPVLRNVCAEEVAHFRAQLTIHNLLEQPAAPAQLAEIAAKARTAPPFASGLQIDLLETISAQPARRLRLDAAGYFIIHIRRNRQNMLHVEHFGNDGRLAHIIEGPDAATLCATIIEMQLVSQLDHAAYLGRELARAETATITGESYVQDRAQGDCGDHHAVPGSIPCGPS